MLVWCEWMLRMLVVYFLWGPLVLKKKTPGPSIKTQAHSIACFSTSPPAPRVCLPWNGLAIITPFISCDGGGSWRMYTRTLCIKWNGQDMKGMAVIEKRAYLVSTKGKGWARGRQVYLVSSQTLGRRWWSARGSWQVLNLSLLSFRRRGCDTTARKGWKQLVRDKWVTIRTQQMEAQIWKINCGDQTRVAFILTAPLPEKKTSLSQLDPTVMSVVKV